MPPTWLALLAPLPDDAVIERKPVATPQMIESGSAGPIAGWESLAVYLSDVHGLRHLLITVDATRAVLSAGDGVMFHREERRGNDLWNIYDHESVGGRFEADGSFRGTRWRIHTEQPGDDEAQAATSSTPSTPSADDVALLRALVAWVIERAPEKRS